MTTLGKLQSKNKKYSKSNGNYRFSQKLNIQEFKDIKTKIGYTNVVEGIKKSLFGEVKEKQKVIEQQTKVEIKEADKVMKEIDKVLEETDLSIIK